MTPLLDHAHQALDRGHTIHRANLLWQPFSMFSPASFSVPSGSGRGCHFGLLVLLLRCGLSRGLGSLVTAQLGPLFLLHPICAFVTVHLHFFSLITAAWAPVVTSSVPVPAVCTCPSAKGKSSPMRRVGLMAVDQVGGNML